MSFQVETTFGLQSRCLKVLGNAFIGISGTLHRASFWRHGFEKKEKFATAVQMKAEGSCLIEPNT